MAAAIVTLPGIGFVIRNIHPSPHAAEGEPAARAAHFHRGLEVVFPTPGASEVYIVPMIEVVEIISAT